MSDLQTKLGGGLNLLQDSLQQGKQKLQTVQEVSQFKKLIQEHAEKRAELLLHLGEVAYQKIRTGKLESPELGQFFLKIAELDQRIFQAQKALEQLNKKEHAWGCSNCGSQITANDKFCGSCGQRQEQLASGIESMETIVCSTCEEQVPSQASFCACCGSRLAV
ncbi:zinc ribbon domain-containing protein [Neobacillus drentensis]|uniref:zinc ribbon domain-containing protein n=1 Tax=Neobacillus drentensis TaxID=220684 RepID=UPI00300010D2